MPLTAEQRAEINRQNAAKSTGPRTDEGKANSRRNATRHGLRAETLAMPNEDPEVVAARSEAWNNYYRPESPAAQHLVNACVAATLLSDRCNKYHEAELTRQVRDAEFAWDVERQEAVEALVVMLKTDPVKAERRLTRTGHGCRWLIGRWELLGRALEERGQWTSPERDEAIRIQGFTPDADKIKECPEAWLTRLFALMCQENPSGVAVEWMFRAHHLPDLYRGDFRPDSLPMADDCRDSLLALVAERLADLRETESALRSSEDLDLAGAADRALILRDGASARLFLRYHAEARTAFHRAYGSLVKALDLDAADADADSPAPAFSPNEPNAPGPVETPGPPQAEAVSPNEADFDAPPEKAEISVTPIVRAETAEAAVPPVEVTTGPIRRTGAEVDPPAPVLRVA